MLSLWSKLLRKIELIVKKVLTISWFKSKDGQGCNFWCDSWRPPWPCVTCKRTRHFLRHRNIPGMMFIATSKRGTHGSYPKCYFWSTGEFEMTPEIKRNIGQHFHQTFLEEPMKIFKDPFERAFFGGVLA